MQSCKFQQPYHCYCTHKQQIIQQGTQYFQDIANNK